ncbi:MAG TPA: 4Fe-4S dicluster domain-containing protein [Vicinamibacteria bacterium]|nr:4Fe-4S dicluster domain-containing protein [Vicinamibacteria bacterium]
MPPAALRPDASGPGAVTSREVVAFVEAASGQKLRECYQCSKCAAGCPIGRAVDLSPQQIVRALQLGQADLALDSRGLWMCVGCQTCVTRCPCEVDLPRVMDALRAYALATCRPAAVREVAVFHRVFLESIRRLGRVYEVGLIGGYNTLSGHLFDSMDLAWPMLVRGKVKPLPRRVRARHEVAAIFSRAQGRREKERDAVRSAEAVR